MLIRKMFALALLAGALIASGRADDLEKVKPLLESAFKRIGEAKTLSVRLDGKLSQGDQSLALPSYDLRLEKPNKLAITLAPVKEGEAEVGAGISLDGNIVSDGEKLWVSAGKLNRYTEGEAPRDFDQLLEGLKASRGLAAIGGAALGLPFAVEPKFDRIFDDVEGVADKGEAEIDGTKFHQVHLTTSDAEVDLFVSQGDKPELRRAAFQFGDASGPILQTDFRDWSFDQPLAANAFAFAPPEGAELADTLIPERPAPQEGPNPLLGKPAPALALSLLDGGDFDLAKHKDKSVVVLDFWATWCGPCVQAMPIIDGVVESLSDKGVVLYAVNLQEDAETVKTFLSEKMLEVTVAMDSQGELAAKYGVQAIPMTVLIGRDGTVQVVHVGFSQNLEETLKTEIQALLEDKNLAEEELKKAAAGKEEESPKEEETPKE